MFLEVSQKNNLQWHSNKLMHLLASHPQRDDGTYGQLNHFQQRLYYQAREMWSSFGSTGFNYHSLLTKTAWDFNLGSRLIWQQQRDAQPQMGDWAEHRFEGVTEVWQLTPTGSRAGCKWRSRLRMSSTSWQTNETSCLCSSSIVAKF